MARKVMLAFLLTTIAVIGIVGARIGFAQGSPAGAVRQGGTAIFALSTNPPHLNSAISTEVDVLRPGLAMLEGLTYLSADMKPQPKLAKSWDVSPDGTVYTFHLREGVTWHDGQPFTSEDVKYNLQEVLKLKSTGKALSDKIKSIDTPDKLTLVVTLSEPHAPTLVTLSDDSAPLIPAHLYRGKPIATNPANLRPVGTGPFKFVSFVQGSRIEMARNDQYWARRPPLDRVVWTIIPDANSRLSSFRSGEVDYVFGSFVDLSAVKDFRRVPGAVVSPARNLPANMVLVFNVTRPPLDNLKVRKALLQGLDRDLIIQAAFDGEAQVAASAIPKPLSLYYSPEVDYGKMYPFDQAAARRLLAEAGVTKLKLDLPFRPDLASAPQIASIIKANWASIGVDVNLISLDAAVWADTIFKKHDFSVTLISYGSFGDPALGIQRQYVCETNPNATFTNASGYCKPDVDRLFGLAARAPTVADRAAKYAEVQKVIASDLPLVSLADNAKIDVGQSKSLGNLAEFMKTWDFSVLYSMR